MSIVDEIIERSVKCLGANPLPLDRLHNGVQDELAFYSTLIREWKERGDALDLAAFTMQTMQMEIDALRAEIKEAGVSSMELGE